MKTWITCHYFYLALILKILFFIFPLKTYLADVKKFGKILFVKKVILLKTQQNFGHLFWNYWKLNAFLGRKCHVFRFLTEITYLTIKTVQDWQNFLIKCDFYWHAFFSNSLLHHKNYWFQFLIHKNLDYMRKNFSNRHLLREHVVS